MLLGEEVGAGEKSGECEVVVGVVVGVGQAVPRLAVAAAVGAVADGTGGDWQQRPKLQLLSTKKQWQRTKHNGKVLLASANWVSLIGPFL